MSAANDEELQQAILSILPFYTERLALSELAIELNVPVSSVRYAMKTLIDKGLVRKITDLRYNPSYVRYRYQIIEQTDK